MSEKPAVRSRGRQIGFVAAGLIILLITLWPTAGGISPWVKIIFYVGAALCFRQAARDQR